MSWRTDAAAAAIGTESSGRRRSVSHQTTTCDAAEMTASGPSRQFAPRGDISEMGFIAEVARRRPNWRVRPEAIIVWRGRSAVGRSSGIPLLTNFDVVDMPVAI